MFSGLTNQMSSWMGSGAKGDQEEKVPTPTEEITADINPEKVDASSPTNQKSKLDMLSNVKSQIGGIGGWLGSSIPKLRKGEENPLVEGEDNPALIDEGDPSSPLQKEEDASSPTKQKSKLDMLSNVKSQIGGIGGWLGSSIPKLRKGDDNSAMEGEDNPALLDEGGTPASAESVKGSPQQKDDDDNSSATGGADSRPQSAADTPTDEKEGQFGNVQSKALAGAKSFGSFLYSAVNKAGKAVTETSAKIKETVEKNTILGEFNKEQEAFLKEQQGSGAASNLPPWVGCANEEALKEECLSLSTDRRNFVRSPPAGVDFKFDYEISYPVAMAIMEQDPNLEKMRYELVPKLISEENFWRNYFYRVSLICQANELSYMAREGDSQSTMDVSDQPLVDTASKETHEFVSDTLQASSEDMIEVEEGLKKLNLKPKQNEEEWERELEAELQDYEVVYDSTNPKAENWEQEIEDILQDVHDLK